MPRTIGSSPPSRPRCALVGPATGRHGGPPVGGAAVRPDGRGRAGPRGSGHARVGGPLGLQRALVPEPVRVRLVPPRPDPPRPRAAGLRAAHCRRLAAALGPPGRHEGDRAVAAAAGLGRDPAPRQPVPRIKMQIFSKKKIKTYPPFPLIQFDMICELLHYMCFPSLPSLPSPITFKNSSN